MKVININRRRPGWPDQSTADDIAAALVEVDAAEKRFSQAVEPDLVYACVLEVTAARVKLNYLFRQAKMEHCK